jgi:tetratricopeptide (TPR) repeat protein
VTLFVAAFLSMLAPAPAAVTPKACPDVVTVDAFVCRALAAQRLGNSADAAAAFEQAAAQAEPKDGAQSRLFAAAGNMWLVAGQPGKAALALDRALALPGLIAEQRGEALLDRARAAAAQGDVKAARARLTEAAQSIDADPFYWYFSAALAIREGNAATAQAAIGKALTLAPADPTILFEAGHVAQFAGDDVGARSYWTRTVARDPNGALGKAAREALKLLPAPLTVRNEPQATSQPR